MTINQFILRNLKQNFKNYYLYVFALIFSVALYFAFVTLQYDPVIMEETGDSIRGGAIIGAASVMLIAIVAVFLMYANNLFIKQRSQEIGLLQLIGLTKNRIFLTLGIENLIIYAVSLIAGIIMGLSFSRLVLMILLHITGVDVEATLQFSFQALVQTIVVFGFVYVLIQIMNYFMIKRQSLLSLFMRQSKSEEQIRKLSFLDVVIGLLGFGMIGAGYYVSSRLFSGDFTTMAQFFLAMLFILASVIVGTYFFYKGSVRFAANVIRKRKNGYLNVNEVLSLSSIMFRMKSNAMLLTIITTVSALAIGLLSLSYISYYSAGAAAESSSPDDFSFTDSENAEAFSHELAEHRLDYSETRINVTRAHIDISGISSGGFDEMDDEQTLMAVVSADDVDTINVTESTAMFSGYNDVMSNILAFDDQGHIAIHTENNAFTMEYIGMAREPVVSPPFSMGFPVVVVSDEHYEEIAADSDPELQNDHTQYIGMNMADSSDIEQADQLFQEVEFAGGGNASQYDIAHTQMQNMGLLMFIVGFLGLTFLITSGCILYFKQMEESEEEKPNYSILRKLGYTNKDILKGIQRKQVFSFGIPLIVGLSHSYFAVQSGWFVFGTELWTPLFIVIGLYSTLYSVFGILSVLYYKKVIQSAL